MLVKAVNLNWECKFLVVPITPITITHEEVEHYKSKVRGHISMISGCVVIFVAEEILDTVLLG